MVLHMCTALIFTFQINFVMESRIHFALYPNCHHHHKTFAKFDLKIQYNLPYEQKVVLPRKSFKCLFWNANDSIAQLMVSLINGVSL